MALPGRDQTFAYENCREMLNKLEREIERYCAVARVAEVPEGEMLLRQRIQRLSYSVASDRLGIQRSYASAASNA